MSEEKTETQPPQQVAHGKRMIMATPQQIEILDKIEKLGSSGVVAVISGIEWGIICDLRSINFPKGGRISDVLLKSNGVTVRAHLVGPQVR